MHINVLTYYEKKCICIIKECFLTGFIRVVTEQWHCTDGTVGYFTFSDFSDEAKAGLNSAMYSTYGLNPAPPMSQPQGCYIVYYT